MPCCNHNITIHCLVQIFYSALDVTNIFPAFSFVFHTIMTKWVRHCIHLFWPKILIKKLPFFNLNILKQIVFDEEGKFVLNFSKKKFQSLLFLFEWQVRKVNQPKENTLWGFYEKEISFVSFQREKRKSLFPFSCNSDLTLKGSLIFHIGIFYALQNMLQHDKTLFRMSTLPFKQIPFFLS